MILGCNTVNVVLESCSLLAERRGALAYSFFRERNAVEPVAWKTGSALTFASEADCLSAVFLPFSQRPGAEKYDHFKRPIRTVEASIFLSFGLRWKDFRLFSLSRLLSPGPAHQSGCPCSLLCVCSLFTASLTFHPGPVQVQCGSLIQSVPWVAT